jgi:1,4-alpha-glucan branching enzyme
MLYAYTEKFILALSHDEIVHGKGSLINKMPGDYWQKFANMKLIFGFMLGHPGKKLSFMGNEFAQFNEWISNNSLDWHLLNFNAHLKFKNYIKAINRIYLRENSLWQDNMTDNFKWINCDDSNRSVVTFFRQMINESSTNNILIFICNFTPVPLLKHRIGVPIKGVYEEILNSDSEKYDGSNILNINLMHSENINYDNYQQSVEIKLAPLAIVILKLICAV